MPSSSPSIESRPSPSPKSGSSLSISSGLMSSRLSALTTSRLSSNSRLPMVHFSDVMGFEMRDEAPRPAGTRRRVEERLCAQQLADLDAKGRRSVGYHVPGLALDQRDRLAGDGDDLQISAR